MKKIFTLFMAICLLLQGSAAFADEAENEQSVLDNFVVTEVAGGYQAVCEDIYTDDYTYKLRFKCSLGSDIRVYYDLNEIDLTSFDSADGGFISVTNSEEGKSLVKINFDYEAATEDVTITIPTYDEYYLDVTVDRYADQTAEIELHWSSVDGSKEYRTSSFTSSSKEEGGKIGFAIADFSKAEFLNYSLGKIIEEPVGEETKPGEMKEEVDASSYDNEYASKMIGLGILDSDFLSSDTATKHITRGEFLDLLMKIVRFKSSDPVAPKYFADVDESYKYSEAISAAYFLGIAKGSGGGYFYPDNDIDFSHAVTFINRALGIPDSLIKSDGTAMISDRALFDKVGVKAGGALTRSSAVIMLCNMLDCYMVENLNGEVKQSATTVLKQYLGLEKTEGVVTAVGAYTLYNDAYVSDKHITVNGEDYVYENVTEELLGKTVTLYYSDDMKAYYADPEERNSIVIKAADIDSFHNLTYTYYEKDKKKTVRIAADCDVVYNGRPAKSGVANLYEPAVGSVRLTDNDNDKAYDVCVITSYQPVVVGMISADKGFFVDKYNTSLKTYYSEESGKKIDLSVLCDAEGSELPWGLLKADDVLLVRESADGKLINATLCTSYTEGRISTVGFDRTTTISVGDMEYKTCKRVWKKDNADPKLGKSYKIYFDKDGYIFAFVEMTTGEYEWAYYIAGGTVGFSGKELQLKFLIEDGSVSVFKVTEKLKIDGKSYKELDKALAQLELGASTAPVMRVSRNDDGVPTAIYTANTTTTDGIQVQYVGNDDNKLTWKPEGGIFGHKVAIDGNTVIFYVVNDENLDDTNRYRVLEKSGLTGDVKYNVDAYVSKNELISEAIVVKVNSVSKGTVSSDTNYLVTDLRYTTTDEGDFVKIYLSATNSSRVALMDKKDFDELGYEIGVGDLVMADIKEDDKILFSTIKVLYDCSEDEINSSYLFSTEAPQGNKVKEILPVVITNAEGSHFEYAISDTVSVIPESRFFAKVGSNVAFKYDKDEKIIKKLNAKDLSPYKYGEDTATRAIMILRYSNLRALYILDDE